jgi:hypothetical protein
MVQEELCNKFDSLILEGQKKRENLGITFYLKIDKEIIIERKPRSNILIDRVQKKNE